MKVKKIIFTLLTVVSLGFASSHHANTSTHLANTSSVPANTSTHLANTSSVPANTSSVPANTSSPLSSLSANPLGSSVIGDLSKQCQAALLGIITSPEFLECVPIPSLIPLLPLVTDPSIVSKFIADPKKNYKPLEGPLLQFATLFCPAKKCSDKGVAGAVKAIQDGCKEDLGKKIPLVVTIFNAAVFYSPIKDITCFKFGKTFCWDETILTAISLPPSPFKLTGNDFLDSVAVADPTAICTKCNKAIYNDFVNFIKGQNDISKLAKQILAGLGVDDKKLGKLAVGAAVKCGINFEDGKIPDK